MNWQDVGKQIAPLAPVLGGVLGGFIMPGLGNVAGAAIGNVIAKHFGVEPTPEKVSDAIRATEVDLAKAKLIAATEEARLKVEGFKEAERQYYETIRLAITETGATMREEIKVENRHWFFTGWRPAAGWVFVFYAAVFGGVLINATVYDPPMLERLTNAWPIFAAFFGTLAAMVGVYVVARSVDKVAGVDTTTVVKQTPAPPPKPAVRR